MMKILNGFLLLLTLFFGSFAHGAVWYVEKDGSGDFTVIQDAVDAAESGDTIMLGPGRYSETSDFQYNSNVVIQVCTVVEKSLSIVGSGMEETFIGPESSSKTEYDTGGFACRSTNLELLIQDLTFFDCSGNSVYFKMTAGGWLRMENVRFENTHLGVYISGTANSYLRDCSFQNINSDGVLILNGQDLEISNCQFSQCGSGINIQFPETRNISISNCDISGCQLVGAYFSNSGSVSVNNCTISDTGNYGFLIENTVGVTINDVIVGGDTGAGIALSGNSHFAVQNSVFEGSLASVVIYSPSLGMVFQNNHIFHYPGAWSVYVTNHYSGESIDLDFTNNYWGTTDLEEISASILDGEDEPDRHMFVVFDPMADSPVSTQQTTLDGVKAMFR